MRIDQAAGYERCRDVARVEPETAFGPRGAKEAQICSCADTETHRAPPWGMGWGEEKVECALRCQAFGGA